jgi:hypothetical protein
MAFLDSDDVWLPWKLEAQLAVLRAFPAAGMVWTDMEAVDPEGQVEQARFLRTMYHAYRWFSLPDLFSASLPASEVMPEVAEVTPTARAYLGDIFSQMVMGNLVHTSTVLLRRERLERVGRFDESFRSGEDYDFHLRTCREGPVAFLDVAAIRYQRGYEDRLTSDRYRIDIAENALSTLTATLARDRGRIHLPRQMLRGRLARSHAWVGEEALALGRQGEARGQLARSLWHQPGQLRVALLLLVSCLSATQGDQLRRAWGATASFLRSAAATWSTSERASRSSASSITALTTTPTTTRPSSVAQGRARSIREIAAHMTRAATADGTR